MTKEDLADAWVDEYGAKYSKDRKRLLEVPRDIEEYAILPGTRVVCDLAFGCFFGGMLLHSVVIPASVTAIGKEAFKNCSSLSSIVIPDSVTTIGDSAFFGCDSLSSVVIPDSVTKIGNSAFWGCSSLSSVVIPDSVTAIGNGAFWGCKSLYSVIIKADTISEFERVKNLLIESNGELGGVEFVKIDK